MKKVELKLLQAIQSWTPLNYYNTEFRLGEGDLEKDIGYVFCYRTLICRIDKGTRTMFHVDYNRVTSTTLNSFLKLLGAVRPKSIYNIPWVPPNPTRRGQTAFDFYHETLPPMELEFRHRNWYKDNGMESR